MEKTKKKSNAQIRKEIIQFLDDTEGLVDKRPPKTGCGIKHRNCMVLATSHNDVPRATPVEFFNEGLTIYVFAEPGGKLVNIRKNPNVSAAIYEQPLDHSKTQKCVQILGTAELLTQKSHPRLLKSKAQKWNFPVVAERMYKAKANVKSLSQKEKEVLMERLYRSISIIKITPERAILREFHTDFSAPSYRWSRKRR